MASSPTAHTLTPYAAFYGIVRQSVNLALSFYDLNAVKMIGCRSLPQLVTLDQAAKLLRVDRRTIQRWMSAGHLTRYRGAIGDRKIYFSMQELRDLTKPRSSPYVRP